jgi:hypothetical protein
MCAKIISFTNDKDKFFLFPPAILCFAQILYIYANNYPNIPASSTAYTSLVYITVTIILTFLIKYFTNSWSKANTISITLILFEFHFFSVKRFLQSSLEDYFELSGILIFSFIAIAIILLIALSNRNNFLISPLFASIFSFTLIGFSSITIIKKHSQAFSAPQQDLSIKKKTKPNITVIVLDQYAGEESLKSYFNFDNSKFIHEMKSISFEYVEKTRSTYNLTTYSMASFFNMETLDVSGNISYQFENQMNAFEIINNNRFVTFLKKNNYKIYNHSIFPFSNIPATYGYTPLIVGMDLLNYHTTSQIIFRNIINTLYEKELFGFNMKSLQKKWIKYQYEHINETKLAFKNFRSDKPTFIYLHLIVPHYPYLMDSNGNPNDPYKMNDKQDKSLYIEYLKYGNSIVIPLLKELDKYDENAITLVLSDHGYYYFDKPTKEGIEFNNILFTKGIKKKIPDSTSTQNILPYVMDFIFDSTFKKTKDTSIFLQ